ncbi:MAG TPA: pyruvate kinase, partial [Candidatus Cloacimonas sp.]|nr:pyruvate kinase [Candidatus Cloacimonas sp.]
PEMLLQMIEAGMDIARLNYSHGEFSTHAANIAKLRQAAKEVGRRLTIMADLPGPKMRIGKLDRESYTLRTNDELILTTEQIIGNFNRVSVSFEPLPRVVKPGDKISLNDGIIQVEVEKVEGTEVFCRIKVGGEIRSNKGLNILDIDLGIEVFTPHDRDCLKSALENDVDAVSQSFVNRAEDILALREEAARLGYKPFVIAKIERGEALRRIDEIIEVSDGIMIARGDLGVETDISRIALAQKHLTARANYFGIPVITATQMLESMVSNPLPTRAEVTDVANAILDGSDCVMLSEESAVGKYPLNAVRMLAKIAEHTEAQRQDPEIGKPRKDFFRSDTVHISDLLTHNVSLSMEKLQPALVVVNTLTGHTARMISRFKLPVWMLAVTCEPSVCQGLQFSSGVFPYQVKEEPEDWDAFIRSITRNIQLTSNLLILVEGPSPRNPKANHRLEILDLSN